MIVNYPTNARFVIIIFVWTANSAVHTTGSHQLINQTIYWLGKKSKSDMARARIRNRDPVPVRKAHV